MAIPPLLKDINERAVLETIRSAAPISRAEISRRIGVSKPTVSLALRSLLAGGLVRETGEDVRQPTYGAVYFEPVPEAAVVLGIDLGARFLRGAICDLAGREPCASRRGARRPRCGVRGRVDRRPTQLPGRVHRPAGADHRRDGCRRPGRRRDGRRNGCACGERAGDRGGVVRPRVARSRQRLGDARERHQPRCTWRTLERCRARRRRLRVCLRRDGPRRRDRAPRRASPGTSRRRRRDRSRTRRPARRLRSGSTRSRCARGAARRAGWSHRPR